MIQFWVVRNPIPMNLNALLARRISKTRIIPVMTKTDQPDARKIARKILSPVDGRATMVRGVSSSIARGALAGRSAGMAISPRSFLMAPLLRAAPVNSS